MSRLSLPLAGALLASLLAVPHASAQAPPADDPSRPVITVYGSVVANTTAATTQLFIPDIPLWAMSDTARLQPPPVGGQAVPGGFDASEVGDFHMTARQTRIGMRMAFAPGDSAWTPSAQVEIDFFGARPNAGHGSAFNQPRMRLALVSLGHRSGWTVVAGQDWAIFAPLNPASFSHFAVPLGAAAGNPWMRLPQLRVEGYFGVGTTSQLLVQAGLLRPLGGGDAPAAGSLADLPSLSGERSGQPFYEGRAALIDTRHGRPQAIGVSLHYGRERVEPETLSTWGAALDVQWPIHSKATLSGELWAGSNLDTFQAGIIQGVSIAGPHIEPVDARGGWMQLALIPAPAWTLHAGAGVDDPDTDGLSAAVARTRNRVLWANAFYRLHPQVTVALQYNHFHTQYRTGTGTGHYGNLGIVFSF
jgi:hypothetical protein